ncbi:NADH-quinone oxidoreductase subunit D [Orchesella cincta]|uniref:glutathione-specific gamma-glutamylcyclotransferase n=1 Tax=Orchesella cincta TaxID=48709 RepID=A0A1D2MQP7_ORCCI|nr:NADH-quinone oxidoreductase subunit D [Orchesella cincta]
MISVFNHSFCIYFLLILILTFPKLSIQRTINENELECNPKGDSQKDQYIVGYGSLIKTFSKNRTYKNTGENMPVLINGYSRVWNCKGVSASLSTTYLGIVPKQNGTLNGVVFKIPNSNALEAYDERELFYCREEVDRDKISLLVSSSQTPANLPSGQFWIYVTKPQYTAFPTSEFPIVQSYVDTFLSGCLEMQGKHSLENFADDCIKTTEGWTNPWINDRIFPRRPFVYEPDAGKIDKLISKHLPKHFKTIKVEK